MFKEDPALVLRYAQNNDDKIESKVTQFLASDPDLLPVVTKLISQTPSSHRTAVGRGLARAALHCAKNDPAVVQKFTSYVNSLGDSIVLSGYTSFAEGEGIQLGKIAKYPSSELSKQSSSELSKPRNDLKDAKSRNDLKDGEFGTELVDPFKEMPLPR
jgi:hypothetical protein